MSADEMNKGKTNKGKLNLQFLEACKCLTEKPDLAELKELVENGADIKAHDHLGFAALKWATHIYDPDVMRFFLENGADLNEAIVEYYKRADKAGIDKIKTAIIDSLRA
ncbi:MAG: hypothetical protein CVV42_17195 [Candidatus Riflebacteria bacterium HGW-Riflebacteria-2]|nr:MAG: hypothetical protein CVV42_17195 [Candidatus Riflebacteria bacterium HGW-Riflebacteria-2]